MKKVPGVNFHPDELSLKNEVIGIFLLFLTFFLIFSLVSYSPLDPSFFHSASGDRIVNFGGRSVRKLRRLCSACSASPLI